MLVAAPAAVMINMPKSTRFFRHGVLKKEGRVPADSVFNAKSVQGANKNTINHISHSMLA